MRYPGVVLGTEAVLAELKNALRSGDIWVRGSRQFKDFDEYLLPAGKFASLRQAGQLPLGIVTDCDRYLQTGCRSCKDSWKPQSHGGGE